MGDYGAVADVGETLVTLLGDNMSDLINPNSIVLLSPAEVEDQNIRLTLFLYSIMDNSHLKNQEMHNISPTQLGYPPLTLDLYYLLTAHSPAQN
ncbi:MAG: Pvc16 family protein, partial [Thermodesulfobacteriota bacterium]